MSKDLVIGIGNLVLSDDAIGPLLVRDLMKDMHINKNIDYKENYSTGLDLLEEIIGYERVIIIDCIKNEEYEPGTCLLFNIDGLDSLKYDVFVDTF